MPVGRFRTDPREFDEVEREVSAKQLPEAALMLGMGLGLTVPLALGTYTAAGALLAPVGGTGPASALLSVLGGVVGYLAGFRYKQYRIARLREAD
jgi:hypothetical protein